LILNTFYSKSMKRWISAGVLTLAALGAVAGCQDDAGTSEPKVDYAAEGEVWKKQIAEAFEHNDGAESFRYAGELVVNAEGIAEPWEIDSLLPALSNGLQWNGFTQREPKRLEATIAFGSAQGQTGASAEPFEIPVIMQDHSLYFRVPMLNQPDEFFVIDTSSEEGDLPQAITQAADSLDELMKYIIQGIDPEYIRLTQPASSEDSSSGQNHVFEIEVTEDNAAHLTAAVYNGWNAWVASFPPEIAAAQAKLVNNTEPLPELTPGSVISVTVSPDGYVIDQQLNALFPEGKLYYDVELSELNQPFEFAQPIPEQTLSFSNVIKFLIAKKSGIVE